MIHFFSKVTPDAWIQCIASVAGTFLSGAFAIWVFRKQIAHERKVDVVNSIDTFIKYFYLAKDLIDKVIFEFEFQYREVKQEVYDLSTNAEFQASTNIVDKLLEELKSSVPSNIPTHIFSRINYIHNVIERINDIGKGFLMNKKDHQSKQMYVELYSRNLDQFKKEMIELDSDVNRITIGRNKIKI